MFVCRVLLLEPLLNLVPLQLPCPRRLVPGALQARQDDPVAGRGGAQEIPQAQAVLLRAQQGGGHQ